MKTWFLWISTVALAAVVGVALLMNVGDAQEGQANLLQEVKTELPSYSLGKSVKIVFAVRNGDSQPISYSFSSSKQFDIWIKLVDKEVYRYSKGKVFLTVITSLTLQPNEMKTFQVDWDQKDADGKQVSPGAYTVCAQLTPMDAQPPSVQSTVRIGVGGMAIVPVTIAEAVARSKELASRKVQIAATYMGWQPNPDDPNIKPGPPVTRSDWGICDSKACMYVTGKVNLDPVKDVGAKVTVVGKLRRTDAGQAYLVLENVVVTKAGP